MTLQHRIIILHSRVRLPIAPPHTRRVLGPPLCQRLLPGQHLPLDLDPQLIPQSPPHPQLRTPPHKIARDTHSFVPFVFKSQAISESQARSPAAAPSSKPAPARS